MSKEPIHCPDGIVLHPKSDEERLQLAERLLQDPRSCPYCCGAGVVTEYGHFTSEMVLVRSSSTLAAVASVKCEHCQATGKWSTLVLTRQLAEAQRKICELRRELEELDGRINCVDS